MLQFITVYAFLSFYLAGEDFILMSDVLTLPLTEEHVCFSVTILSDDRPEEAEQFTITLIPEADLQTSRAEINVTIVENITIPIGIVIIIF